MDWVPFEGRILLRAETETASCLRELFAGSEGTRHVAFVGSPERLTPGDLWLDLQQTDPVSSFAECRARQIRYLGRGRGDRSQRRAPNGPTVVLGAGACSGLIAAFVRVALRDFIHKTLRQRPDDPRRPELLKLLGAGRVERLVPLVGIHSVTLVAPPTSCREEAILTLRHVLGAANESLTIRVLDQLDNSGDLGVILHGYGRNDWWTGSHPGTTSAPEVGSGYTPFVLQTAANVLAATVWMLRNPDQGTRLAEELPYEEILEVALPHLGDSLSRSL